MQLQEGPLAALPMAITEGVVWGDNVDLCGHLEGQAVGGWEGNLQGAGTGGRCRCKVSAWVCRHAHLDVYLDVSAHPPGCVGTPTWMCLHAHLDVSARPPKCVGTPTWMKNAVHPTSGAG